MSPAGFRGAGCRSRFLLEKQLWQDEEQFKQRARARARGISSADIHKNQSG
jgi:hypothetical protein